MATPRRVRALVLILLLAAGCRFLPRPTDTVPDEIRTARWVEPCNPPENYVPVEQANVSGLAAALAGTSPPLPAPPRPLNVLSLSAGGKYGAYSAGVLAGWTANGTRPQFDVVTGASAGVIVALYAFLGPQYDPALRQFFTQTEDADLYRYRPVRNLIRYGSLATADGLTAIIDREVNDSVMEQLRAGHAAGRRLFVATLNQRTKRLTAWDLTTIAASGRADAKELIRKVMLAATAVPGLVPPVEFTVTVNGVQYTEVHADGGPATQSFVRLGPEPTAVPGAKWLAGSNLYVIAAGKLFADPGPARLTLIARLGAGLSASLYALYRAELFKLWALCLHSGMTYNLVLLPGEFRGNPSSFQLDPAEMARLYRTGYEQAAHGVPWRHLPPGAYPGEEATPRGGLQFVTEPAGAACPPAGGNGPRGITLLPRGP